MIPFTGLARRFAPVALLAILAGCAGGSSGYTVSGNQCNAAQHQALVGRNVGEIILPPSLPKREIAQGRIVPQDYNPRRLNMYVDPKGWVGRITCG
ncbi:MAG: I78 family peptidase inhibitor [Paracoccus sp. (in: a-proteobacteria)]